MVCTAQIKMNVNNHYSLVLLPSQSSIKKVQMKNGNTPYNVSLTEWEWLSTALNTVRQKRAASSHAITPGTDIGT
jgi:hypothetical protein